MIRDRGYSRGNKLPSERELAHQLGVSRVILREAIVALETLGVLETKERLGVYVCEPDLGPISESLRLMPFWPERFVPYFMEIRLIIDVSAAELAAKKRTDQHLKEMKECLEVLRSFIVKPKEDVRAQAHYEYLFHTLIVESAQNPILSKIWEGLVSLIEKYNEILHQELIQDNGWIEKIVGQHELTLVAIEEKNPEEAAKTMKNHHMEIKRRHYKKQE